MSISEIPQLSAGISASTAINPAMVAKRLTAAESADSPDAKLKKAAQDFEGLLLASLLDEMKSFSDSLGSESDPGSSSVQGLGISALSSAISKAGGIGLGKMVLQQLESVNAHNEGNATR